uniref:Serine/threonine-protein kinase ATR n=1 Tax=Rhizophora mucronata TaxID=61149 RepID=A0A2P2NZF5_RHIMU
MSPSTYRVPSVKHLLSSLIIHVTKGCHLVFPVMLIRMPSPLTGLLLAGRSMKQAGSLEIPAKDVQKHLKFTLPESGMLELSAESEATCKRSSAATMASKNNLQKASRAPVRSKDSKDPTVSKIVPCHEQNAGSAKKGNILPMIGSTTLAFPW